MQSKVHKNALYSKNYANFDEKGRLEMKKCIKLHQAFFSEPWSILGFPVSDLR